MVVLDHGFDLEVGLEGAKWEVHVRTKAHQI